MQIKFRSNNILLWGDTHDVKYAYRIIQNKPNLDGFDIVHLGDLGLGFNRPEWDAEYLQKISAAAKKRGIRLFIIRGNHDDPGVWERGYGFDNLFLVKDYTSAIFPNGKRALLVGGGVSIDRPHRTIDFDYWPGEVTPYRKINEHFDYLFSHDCPDYFNYTTESLWVSPYKQFLIDDKNLFGDALAQRRTMNKIVDDIKPSFIAGGHFHRSIMETKNDIIYKCVDINEIILFEAL